MSFGERLKRARKAKKLTQAEVAALTNRDFTSISRWENNRSEPDRETLLKLSDLYGVPINELMGEDYNEEEKEVLTKMAKAVPLKKISQEHEVEWDGKILNEYEKMSLLSFMDTIIKMREENNKK